MTSIKKGDMVIYVPDPNDEDCQANGISGGLPAIVVSIIGNTCNLRVFTDSEDVLWRSEVPVNSSFLILDNGSSPIETYPGGCCILRS